METTRRPAGGAVITPESEAVHTVSDSLVMMQTTALLSAHAIYDLYVVSII